MRVRTRACPQAHRCSIRQTNQIPSVPRHAEGFSLRFPNELPWEWGTIEEGIIHESRDFSWVETLKRYREDDWAFRRNQVSYAFNPPYSPGRSVSSDDQRCLFHLGRSGMPYTCPRAQSADIFEFGFCSSNSAAVKPWVHYVVALPYPDLKNNVTENVYLWPITRIK